MPRAEPRITLLTRPGCHLCDDARDVVARVAGETGVGWVETSVDGDPALQQQYSDLVPVVLVDGARHAYWQVDEERLRDAVDAPGGGSSWLRRWRRTP